VFVKKHSPERVVLVGKSLTGIKLTFAEFLGEYYSNTGELVLHRSTKIKFLPDGCLVVYMTSGVMASLQFPKGEWRYL
jgi:hypothetical protein